MSHISQKGPYHYTYLSKGDEEEKRSTNTLDFDDLIEEATLLLKQNYKYK